ncbi:MAG TPA: polysaccharide deacetylase family protein [Solirubrobacteraceae bacterium]|nr:polysaccharide deacetylase family protein [Solirubrobacteraceae bacterium]
MSLVPARLRAALPDPLADRGRLVLARRLEARSRRSSTVRGAALVFHAVAPRAGDPQRELEPAVSTRFLDEVVGYLSRRYALVRARDLPSAARARRPGERLPVAFTFDDDLPSHREHAAPVFAGHGAVATAFLCGARSSFWFQLLQPAIDGRAIAAGALAPVAPELVEAALEGQPGAIRRLAKAVEDLGPAERDRVTGVLARAVAEPPPVLGADGAGALAGAGWELGFHTRRHDVLVRLGDDDLREALEPGPVGPDGELPRTLAYPHGKAGAREAEAARRAGYVAAFTGRPDAFDETTDDHLIGRLQPDNATLGRFALHLARSLSAAARPTS